RRPGEAADAVFDRRDPARFAAARIDDVNLPLVVAVGGEGQFRAVVRPGRRRARLLGVAGQLPRVAALHVGGPGFGVVVVVVPVCFAHGVGDPLAGGRDPRPAGALQRDELVDRRHGTGVP